MSSTGPRPRLLALNQYYWPGLEADGQLLAQLCEDLADEYDVSVVTGRAAHARRPGRTLTRGVTVVRVPSTALDRARLALRALNYGTYSLLVVPVAALRPRPDVVLSLTNPPFLGALASLIARRFRAPLVLVSQDVFPVTAVVLGEGGERLVRTLGAVASAALRRADCVVAIGETMRDRLVEQGAKPGRIRVIPNWVDAAAVTPLPRDNPWSRGQGLAGSFVVMHAGNVGRAQDLGTLVQAATLLEDLDRLEVVIVGSGAGRAELVRLAHRIGAHRVRFLPYQPRPVLSQLLSTAAVHVVGLARGLAVQAERTDPTGRPAVVALGQTRVRDHQLPGVEDVVGDQTVQEVPHLDEERRRLRLELGHGLGEPVRDLHLAALHGPQQLALVVARDAERVTVGHHRHHQP